MYGIPEKGMFKHRTYEEKGQYQYHNNDNKRFVYYSNNLWLHLTDVQVFYIYITILFDCTMIRINFGMACNGKKLCCRGFGSRYIYSYFNMQKRGLGDNNKEVSNSRPSLHG